MALFKILEGDSSRVSTDITPFHEGWAYFTPDDGGFYIDSAGNGSNQRIQVNPKSKKFEGVLRAAGWSAGRQTLAVPGLGADQNGVIGLAGSVTDAVMDACKNADLRVTGQSAGSIVIEAKGTQPAEDIPVIVILFA